MVKKIKLGEIEGINIIGGQITARIKVKENEEIKKEYKVLIPKTIQNGNINLKDIEVIKAKQEVDKERLTKKDDIIFKLSTPYDSCLINEETNLLVPSFEAIISNLPNTIKKEYLLAYLNSESCLNQIKSMVGGNTIQILSLNQIKKIEIPLIDLKEQQEIGNSYINSLKLIKTMEKVKELEKEYLNSKFYEMEE